MCLWDKLSPMTQFIELYIGSLEPAKISTSLIQVNFISVACCILELFTNTQTDRVTVSWLTNLVQNSMQIYIFNSTAIYQKLFNLSKFHLGSLLCFGVNMFTNTHTDKMTVFQLTDLVKNLIQMYVCMTVV